MAVVKNVKAASGGETSPQATNSGLHSFTDSVGRHVTIRRLRGAQRMRFLELLGEATQNPIYMGMATLAAAIAEVNGEEIGFPRSKSQLEAIVERFDDGLLDEVAAHYGEAFPVKSAEEIAEAAKNS